MVKQTKKTNVDTRDLWLAGLGVVSLARKQTLRVYGTLVEEGTQFRDATNQRFEALTSQARNSFGEVRAKVEARVDPFIVRASDAYETVRNEVETRFAPVVARFGTGKAAKPAARKRPAAKKATTKPAKKAAARRPSRKAA